MKRFVFTAPNKHEVETVDDLRLGGDEDVLIDVKGIGLCGTDLHIYRGHRPVEFPHVSGHECVGVVREVGTAVTTVNVGDMVTVEPNFTCLGCSTCLSGHKNLCKEKTILGVTIPGCFAEMVLAPQDCVWKLPPTLSVEESALVETATVSFSGIKKANLRLGERVLVIGAGCIGLLAMRLAILSGAFVSVSDINHYRLDQALKMGAEKVYLAGSEEPEEESFDVVIDAAGVPATIGATTRFTISGGRIILIGVPPGEASLNINAVVRRELKIFGSVACVTEFPEVIALIENGTLDVKPLVTHRLTLERIIEGLELMEKGETLKPVVLL